MGGTGSTDGVVSSESSLGFEAVPRKHQRVVPQQQDISAAMIRPLTNGDLRAANHTALTTAIAIFFHAHNIVSGHTVESRRWLHMPECARAVGATYKCPNCKDIGGDLLNINPKNYKIRNLISLGCPCWAMKPP